jgi:hypothetical protein
MTGSHNDAPGVRGVLQSVRATRSNDGQTGGHGGERERLNGAWCGGGGGGVSPPLTQRPEGVGRAGLCVGLRDACWGFTARSPESDGPWFVMRGACCSRQQAKPASIVGMQCTKQVGNWKDPALDDAQAGGRDLGGNRGSMDGMGWSWRELLRFCSGWILHFSGAAVTPEEGTALPVPTARTWTPRPRVFRYLPPSPAGHSIRWYVPIFQGCPL